MPGGDQKKTRRFSTPARTNTGASPRWWGPDHHQGLLPDPCRRWVLDRGHGKEVTSYDFMGVVGEECPPGLRRRLAWSHHVPADGRFIERVAQLGQLAVKSSEGHSRSGSDYR